jgi:hypothetical protein
VSLPAWTRRFNIDTGLEIVEQTFPDITVDALTGHFVFPAADPVIAWVNSLRAGTEEEIDSRLWDDIVTELRTRIDERIERYGHFTARKCSGVIIAC